MKNSYLLLIVCFACGCSVDEQPLPVSVVETDSGESRVKRTRAETMSPVNDNLQDDPEMILGDTLDNPYQVSSMQMAYNRLPAPMRAKVPGFSVRTTHRYYKFPCVDSTRLDETTQFAADNNIELYDYPFLEREVLQEGIYRDPTRMGTTPNPLYGVFPANLTPPATLDAVLVQSLCVLDEDLYEDAPTTRAEMLPDDFVVALINESMTLTGNTQDLIAPDTRGGSDKWTPSGKIQAWDN